MTSPGGSWASSLTVILSHSTGDSLGIAAVMSRVHINK